MPTHANHQQETTPSVPPMHSAQEGGSPETETVPAAQRRRHARAHAVHPACCRAAAHAGERAWVWGGGAECRSGGAFPEGAASVRHGREKYNGAASRPQKRRQQEGVLNPCPYSGKRRAAALRGVRHPTMSSMGIISATARPARWIKGHGELKRGEFHAAVAYRPASANAALCSNVVG